MSFSRPSRLQTTYQRNMLIAILSTAASVLLPCTALLLFQGQSSASVESVIHRPTGAPANLTPESSGGGSGGMRLPIGSPRAGFIGFVGQNVRIIPSHTSVADPDVKLITTAAELTPETGDLAFGSGAGWGDGSFVAGTAPAYDLSWLDEIDHEAVNRGVEVIVTYEPEYPWVALEQLKEGMVSFIIRVGVDGKLAPFSTRVLSGSEGKRDVEVFAAGVDDELLVLFVDENPEGWFFRDKVEDVLFKWAFAPAVVNGAPVERFCEVTYHFCLTKRCRKLFVESMGR